MARELEVIVNQLRSTLGKMEVVLSSIAESIVWATPGGRIEWCNAPFDALIGKPHIKLLGAMLIEVMQLEQSGLDVPEEAHPATIASAGVSGSGVYTFSAGENVRQLEISWSAIQMASLCTTIVLTIKDITERQSAQDALEREVQFLHLYESISAAANEAEDVEQAVQFSIERICKHMQWPVGHAYMVVKDKDTVRLEPSKTWFLSDPARFENFKKVTEEMVLQGGEGLPGRVHATRKPEWIVDISRKQDAEFPRAAVALEDGLRSAFGFPILARGNVVAVLEFFSPDVEEPDTRLLQVLTYFGAALGRAFEIKQSEEALVHRALHDALTDLPNRSLFARIIEQAIMRQSRNPHYQFAVLYIDIDRFKVINDSLGHHVGDLLLMEVSTRLSQKVRAGDMVARLGGDEFAVFLDDVPATGDCPVCQLTAERIQGELQKPYFLDDHQVHATASIGMAISKGNYHHADEILRDADIAMYRAKSHGGSRTEIFDTAMHSKAIKRQQTEVDLRQAIQRGELLLHYQPICSIHTGIITGFEALLRWQHPKRGLIGPSEFIPVAEEARLIIGIGKWVLQEACMWLSEFPPRMGGCSGLTISVNVSGRQFEDDGLVEHIRQVLKATGLSPNQLHLEITESVMMEQVAKIQPILENLADTRVHLHVDDFGTGYSSLSYLSRLPIDALKIDRSFISGLESNPGNNEIVRCIMALGNTLSLGVIAEGVETLGEAEQLALLGCELVQGYYFSRPVDGDAARNLVAAQRAKVMGESVK